MSDFKFYYDALYSVGCQCGMPKKSSFSFCYDCYSSLPSNLQRALYKKFNEGYGEAYEEAVKWLTEDKSA